MNNFGNLLSSYLSSLTFTRTLRALKRQEKVT